jgi:hypothetical protein
MKSLLLAGVMTVAFGTACFAGPLYWVVGNRATSKCDIVTRNPVIFGYAAYDGSSHGFWFGDGPYRSLDEAKLARSTIGVCPKDNSPGN